MNLRPYQQKLISDIFSHWKNGRKRVLMQLPTGGGKTILFNHIAALAEKKGHRVLIVADRRELIMQAWNRLFQASGIHAGIIMSGVTPAYHLPVQIASVQTLNRRSFPPDINLVIIDECRGSVAPTYAPIFGQYKDAFFLGVDATPIRTNGQGFDHIYQELVHGPSIKDMEVAGALVPANVKVNPINQSSLSQVKMIGGDYDEGQLARVMMGENIMAGLVASKQKHAPGEKTICFAVNIEHSKAIVAKYNEAGIKALHVDGSFTIEDRNRAFKAFEHGDVEVLVNVGIATYGYDNPSITCVQLARPTKSLALYLQMCLDSKTEILTERGWLSHSEITDSDLVYGFDVCTNECRLAPIQEIIVRQLHAEEKMYAIKSPHLDIRITGGHDMLTKPRKRPNMKWRKVTAIEAASRKDMYTVPVSAIESGTLGAKLIDREIEFIGWFLSDGTRNKITNAISISQSSSAPERCDKIREVLRGCGMKFGEHRVIRKDHMKGYSDLIQFNISYGKPRGTDKHLTGYAHLEMWVDKSIPEIFETLDYRQFRVLISAFWMGDGRKMAHADYTPRTLSITCGDNRLMADRIQSLCIRRGLRCNVSIEKKEGRLLKYNLHIKERTTSTISGTNCKDSKIGGKTVGRTRLVEVEAQVGELVWCVKNELGTIFTRRNGKVVITGNCGRGARPFTSKDGTKKLSYTILDHANCRIEHGAPNADRKWTLKGKGKTPPSKEDKKIKMIFGDGKERIISSREIPQDLDGVVLVDMTDAELEGIGRRQKFDKINERRVKSSYQPMWAYFRFVQEVKDFTLDDLEYIQKKLNFKYGWASFKWKEKEQKEKRAAA